MNSSTHNSEWEQRLREGLGTAPEPDFADWSARNPDALAVLKKPASVARPDSAAGNLRGGILTKSWKWSAAAILVACGLLWFRPGGNLDRGAFAATIPGVDEVQTMSWTSTYFLRFTSADGKRTWLQTGRRMRAYRRPGLYRDTILDEAGEPRSVEITDAHSGKMLRLDLREKRAVMTVAISKPDLRGPFAWVGDALRERMVGKSQRVKSVSLKGQKTVDGAPANIVRALISKGNDRGYYRSDFLFDAESKRLVGLYVPNEVDFDPETAADRDNSPDKDWSTVSPVAGLEHEILLNPKLDASDFSLEPPAGFSFETRTKPTLTEDELIAYLGAAARFSDNQFPDSPDVAFDREKFNAACRKDAAARTPVEQALIELHDRFKLREIYRSPVLQFVDDHATPNSFQYVGAEVKVGQADRIVCWYKLRNAQTFRAIFGDLSVKDVAEKDLPLNIAN